MVPRIALTAGEPAGIGPDLVVMLAQQAREAEIVAIADGTVLEQRAEALNLSLTLRHFDQNSRAVGDSPGTLCISHHPVQQPVKAGTLNSENARYVLNTLDDAITGCMKDQYQAMVTGPVHKGIINEAGILFSGHTEYIAEATNADPVMLLMTEHLKVALATTHIPVNQIAASITPDLLGKVIRTLHHDLLHRFGVESPTILVCGLNPHAGEGGHLGMEEIDVIIPTLKSLREEGMDLVGPLPADTLFTPTHLEDADAVLAMYHDQGLPVLKFSGFGSAINVTLGLPLIRTSVDHGTALDRAGTGNVNAGSLDAALALAQQLSKPIH